jgi:hypothetical protein
MQAALSLDEPTWNRQPHRLAVCMAISAFAVFLFLATLDWPPRFNFPRLIPLELVVTLRDAPDVPAIEVRERPQAEPREVQQPEARTLPAPTAPAAPATPATPPQPAEVVVTEPAAASAAQRVDWQVELERVAAKVIAEAAAEPQSMHPEFAALRRIAALRYSKPLTNEPSSTWQEENRYTIRDPGLVNRYAFGTFEGGMIQFTIPFGRPRPKNLPWVATIRARYDYLDKKPDELPIVKAIRGNPAGR